MQIEKGASKDKMARILGLGSILSLETNRKNKWASMRNEDGNKKLIQGLLRRNFSCGSAGKEFACNTGDLGLIPGLGKVPWRRERLPPPIFRPGEFHPVHGITNSRIPLSDFHFQYFRDSGPPYLTAAPTLSPALVYPMQEGNLPSGKNWRLFLEADEQTKENCNS